jgi:hypothetical protein
MICLAGAWRFSLPAGSNKPMPWVLSFPQDNRHLSSFYIENFKHLIFLRAQKPGQKILLSYLLLFGLYAGTWRASLP